MDKWFAFIGVAALILLLLPSFVIAQSENSDLMDTITQIWESIAGTETVDETTETIETPPLMESREGDQISDSGIEEGATTSLPYHETRESVFFEVVPVQEYDIFLYAGWNLISTPYQLVNETLDSFLENVEGEWNIIQTLSKENCQAPDYYCRTKAETFVRELDSISNLQGYWINVSQTVDQNITAIGIHYYKEIDLFVYEPDSPFRGWNLIGYPRNSSVTVGSFLNASLGSNWVLFETYENGDWLYAIEETPEPLRDTIWTLKNVTPTKGYCIKMSEDDTLVIPETTRPY